MNSSEIIPHLISVTKNLTINQYIIMNTVNMRDLFMASLLSCIPFTKESVKIIDDIIEDDIFNQLESYSLLYINLSILDCLLSYQTQIIEVFSTKKYDLKRYLYN